MSIKVLPIIKANTTCYSNYNDGPYSVHSDCICVTSINNYNRVLFAMMTSFWFKDMAY